MNNKEKTKRDPVNCLASGITIYFENCKDNIPDKHKCVDLVVSIYIYIDIYLLYLIFAE